MEYSGIILGWLLGIVSLVIAELIRDYFSQRSLKAQQEHSERIVKMQLFNEDKKEALIELDKLFKTGYKTFDDFKKAVITFLDGKQGLFLPRELSKELRGEVLKLDSFLFNRLLELGHYQEPPDEYYENDYEAWAEAFPEEALDAEIRSRLREIKGSMRDKIKKYISEEG